MRKTKNDRDKRDYFDFWESNAIIKLIETDPFEAKKQFEDYFQRYSRDYYAYAYYIMLLVRIGDFNSAEILYNQVETLSSNDRQFLQKTKKLYGFKHNMLVAKMQILAYQERYQELYYLYLNNLTEFEDIDGNYISYFCKAKLGLLDKSKLLSSSYRFMQVVDYHEEAFLEHIKKHMQFFNKKSNYPSLSVFSESFPMQEVLCEIKKYIPSNKRIYPSHFEDFYYFKFDECGRYNNKLANFFLVVVFHNTENFITMYPVIDKDKLPFTDLNYLRKDKIEDDCKIKKLSQIDKFNRRYHR